MKETLPLNTSNFAHISVLSRELIEGVELIAGGHYLDATVGGGGHSRAILATFPDITLTGVDRDAEAITAATVNLAEFGDDRYTLWRGNFAEYKGKNKQFDGIIADIGVSSPQLDLPERGFSFRHDSPLDMRMDRRQPLTAADIVNFQDEKALADIFYRYGEERLSRRIARHLVQKRPFQSTKALAEAIARAVPRQYRYGRIHPATRSFQALRLVVNDELPSLQQFLTVAPQWLKPQGRIGIISFHSLEDRIIKHAFRDNQLLQVITKKPITAQAEEIAENPRARSAKLRFAFRKLD